MNTEDIFPDIMIGSISWSLRKGGAVRIEDITDHHDLADGEGVAFVFLGMIAEILGRANFFL